VTAAVFFTRMAVGETVIPMRARMFVRLWFKKTVCAVASACQSRHQAVTDQLVFAYAFDIGQDLEPRVGGPGGREQKMQPVFSAWISWFKTAADLAIARCIRGTERDRMHRSAATPLKSGGGQGIGARTP
jgi:hypothetical protein